jgi:hypothetical protein
MGEGRGYTTSLVPIGYLDTIEGPTGPLKSLILLAPRAGFEPATNRLTANPKYFSLAIFKVHRLLISADNTCVI